MKKQPDEIVKNLLSFKWDEPYFGRAKHADIRKATKLIKASQSGDSPHMAISIDIGYIDSAVIRNALAKEMSYNPVRWGNPNPFMSGTIYQFCRGEYKEKCFNSIKTNLYDFLRLNANPNKQWSDRPLGQGGCLNIELKYNGNFNCDYHKISALQKCIKIIATQNLADFERKRGSYRKEIIKQMSIRYPKLIKTSDFEPVMLPDVEPETQLDLFGNYKMITKQEYMEKLEQAKQSIGRNNRLVLEKQR